MPTKKIFLDSARLKIISIDLHETLKNLLQHSGNRRMRLVGSSLQLFRTFTIKNYIMKLYRKYILLKLKNLIILGSKWMLQMKNLRVS